MRLKSFPGLSIDHDRLLRLIHPANANQRFARDSGNDNRSSE
jgi:hypothetical protein